MTRTNDWPWVTALGMFWGFSVAAASVSLEAGLPPLLFAVLETALISTVCAVTALARRQKVSIDAERLRVWAVSGTFVIVIPYMVSYTALTHLTAGEVTVILALAPVLTSILAILLRAEPVNFWVGGGAAVSLTGIAIVAANAGGSTSTHMSSTSHGVWVLVAIASPLCYAIANVYIVSRPALPASDPLLNVLGANLIGFLLLAIVLACAATAGMAKVPDLNKSVAFLFLALAALANAAANFLFFVAARRMAASILGLSGYITTVFGVLFGIVLADDLFSWHLMSGGLLVLFGVFVATRQNRMEA